MTPLEEMPGKARGFNPVQSMVSAFSDHELAKEGLSVEEVKEFMDELLGFMGGLTEKKIKLGMKLVQIARNYV